MTVRDKGVHKRMMCTGGRIEKVEGISEFQCCRDKAESFELQILVHVYL